MKRVDVAINYGISRNRNVDQVEVTVRSPAIVYLIVTVHRANPNN